MYEKILRAVKRNVEDDEAIYNIAPCPDAKRCVISFSNDKFSACESNDIDKPLRKLVFVLESPHKSEFDKLGSPIEPAQGITGKKFDEVLINFLVLAQYHHNCFISGHYEVWLVNAVQYQVSLGIKTKNYRSIIFQIVWYSFAREDFKERLSKLIDDDSVIFNACTRGNDSLKGKAESLIAGMRLSSCFISKLNTTSEEIDLSALVEEAIKSCNLVSYKASHPSRWDKLIS